MCRTRDRKTGVGWAGLAFLGWAPHVRLILLTSLLGMGVIALSSCSGDSGRDPPPPSQRGQVPVTVAAVVQRDVPVDLQGFGSVEAYSSVGVKAQAAGILQTVHFTQGQFVQAGDMLFTIDPRPYEAALRQAQAMLARDTAQAKNARREANRVAELLKRGAATQDENETARTTAEAMEATAQADQAAVEVAQIQLDYCYIRSPIDGRTGSLLVNQGNLIKVSDVPLVMINQIQPIYVTFSIIQQELPQIQHYQQQHPLPVRTIIPHQEQNPVQGELTFIDNTVDPTTGMIRLRATFSNSDQRLWPGQFVNVVITVTTQRRVIVAPSQAIQPGQQGSLAFVVKDDMTVQQRAVTTGRLLDGGIIVTSGLQPGEVVVTDGQLDLRDGSRVTIRGRAPEVAASGPASASTMPTTGATSATAPAGPESAPSSFSSDPSERL